MSMEEVVDKVSGVVLVLGEKLQRNLFVAQRRVDCLERQFEGRGLFVITNRNFNAGVDMIVVEKQTARIIQVCEITNYKHPWEFIKDEKFRRYIENLNSFNPLVGVRKVMYVSYAENLTVKQRDELERNNIELCVLGGQD